jgi:hypothetical protein
MMQQRTNGDTSPVRVANGDIVERLRKWFHDVNAVSAIDLMDEAANEIERLRNGAVDARETVTLTDEEREAIYRAESRLRQFDRLQPIEPADATPATHATPGEGSVHGESSTPKSYETSDEKRVVCDMKQEPVAWAYEASDGQIVAASSSQDRVGWDVRRWNGMVRDGRASGIAKCVPLYRQSKPTLTDEEREAIVWCVELLDELESSKGDALRSLLERLK